MHFWPYNLICTPLYFRTIGKISFWVALVKRVVHVMQYYFYIQNTALLMHHLFGPKSSPYVKWMLWGWHLNSPWNGFLGMWREAQCWGFMRSTSVALQLTSGKVWDKSHVLLSQSIVWTTQVSSHQCWSACNSKTQEVVCTQNTVQLRMQSCQVWNQLTAGWFQLNDWEESADVSQLNSDYSLSNFCPILICGIHDIL